MKLSSSLNASESDQFNYSTYIERSNSSRYFRSENIDGKTIRGNTLLQNDVVQQQQQQPVRGTKYGREYVSRTNHLEIKQLTNFSSGKAEHKTSSSDSGDEKNVEPVSNLILDLIWIILLVVDVLLFVYRLTYLVIDVDMICHGTEEKIVVQTLQMIVARFASKKQYVIGQSNEMMNTDVNNTLGSSNKLCADFCSDLQDSHATDAFDIETTTVLNSEQEFCLDEVRSAAQSVDDQTVKSSVVKLCVYRNSSESVKAHNFVSYINLSWKMVNEGEIVSKLIVLSICLFVILLAVKIAYRLLKPGLLLSFCGLSSFLDVLFVHLQTANNFISLLTSRSTEQLNQWRSSFANFELKQLQGIQKLFYAGN